jgi:hypothetical protein
MIGLIKSNMIFLSASIPDQTRDEQYFASADIIAIRDAVRALATVVIPKTQLIWGGHPTITPLIRYVMMKMNSSLKEHLTVYQSNFYKESFPVDIFDFEHIEIVPESLDEASSQQALRNAMIIDNNFLAGVFIGGMEGVELEYEIFKEAHPNALVLPVASTGGAARLIYGRMNPVPDHRLRDEYAYMALFKALLKDIINNE